MPSSKSRTNIESVRYKDFVLVDADELMHALADKYYKHFEIAALRHKQDSALIYLEKRAALDTTRTSWQFLAGYYAYYLRSLAHGEHAKFILLNMLGTLYTVTGRYAESKAAL